MAQELFDLGYDEETLRGTLHRRDGEFADQLGKEDGLAIMCNPDGRFHGWLFRKHPDGQWVSLRKLKTIELSNTF